MNLSALRLIKSFDNYVDFDEECSITFDEVYKEFISKQSKNKEHVIDVIDGKMRSEFRTFCHDYVKKDKEKAVALLQILKQNPKQVARDNLSMHIPDPFELLGYTEKTDVQMKVEQHANWMQYYGNYAYSCSCGAGKTLAGIYVMYKLQCKTLIISSRNAVNDQWLCLIETLYPNLIIRTKKGNFKNGKRVPNTLNPDVCIFSPQYLKNKLDYNFDASLIIYDEVHSLLSKEFIKVLLFPLMKVNCGTWSEIPFMIALSATYPSNSTHLGKEANVRINRLFGRVFKFPSIVTRIPVKVWDYRDHYEAFDKSGQTLKGEQARGSFDHKYEPLDDFESVKYFCEKIKNEGKIDICPEYKGIIMTYTINSSVYAALFAHKFWNCNVVLVRATDESCLLLEKDKDLDFTFNTGVTMSNLQNIGTWCDYKDVVDRCCIIAGTVQRLKEGFSVQNITWGICTKFVYNTIPRVQILGRIRRNSNDEALNNHERIFYVCSAQVPTTIGIPFYKGKHRITYDFATEKLIFEEENYVRI